MCWMFLQAFTYYHCLMIIQFKTSFYFILFTLFNWEKPDVPLKKVNKLNWKMNSFVDRWKIIFKSKIPYLLNLIIVVILVHVVNYKWCILGEAHHPTRKIAKIFLANSTVATHPSGTTISSVFKYISRDYDCCTVGCLVHHKKWNAAVRARIHERYMWRTFTRPVW